MTGVEGMRSAMAWSTTYSTQPSTRASSVSRRETAWALREEIRGDRSMPCRRCIASWMAAGSPDSRLSSRVASSMWEVSMTSPAAYSSTEETRRSTSHGTWR